MAWIIGSVLLLVAWPVHVSVQNRQHDREMRELRTKVYRQERSARWS